MAGNGVGIIELRLGIYGCRIPAIPVAMSPQCSLSKSDALLISFSFAVPLPPQSPMEELHPEIS